MPIYSVGMYICICIYTGAYAYIQCRYVHKVMCIQFAIQYMCMHILYMHIQIVHCSHAVVHKRVCVCVSVHDKFAFNLFFSLPCLYQSLSILADYLANKPPIKLGNLHVQVYLLD